MSRFATVKANMTILEMLAVSQTATSIVMNDIATLVAFNHNIVHVDRFVAMAAEAREKVKANTGEGWD